MRLLLFAIGSFAVLGFLVLIVAGPTSAEQFLFGWLYFPLRVFPRITVDSPTAILGVVCTVAFLIGLHVTVRWFLRQAGGSERRPNWSIRSTFAVALATLLLFAAGTAMVGATHQLVWLLTRKSASTSSNPNVQEVSGVVSQAQTAARRIQTKNQLTMIGLGLDNYSSWSDTYPVGGYMTEDGTLMHGWAAGIGVYVGFSSSEIDFSIPWNRPPNDRLYKCGIHGFINPSVSEVFDKNGYGLNHFAGNVHVLPIRQWTPTPRLDDPYLLSFGRVIFDLQKNNDGPLRIDDITDGTSNTLFVGEVASRFKPWGHPTNVRDPAIGINRSPDGFGSAVNAGGTLFLFCDGSVRTLNENIDPAILRALATPAGNESLPQEFNFAESK
jgi:hypothetical protein